MVAATLSAPTILEVSKKVATGQLPERDIAIVQAVWRYGMMTSKQIRRLLFPSDQFGSLHSADTVCRRRLQVLIGHQILDRFRLSTNQFYIYVLAKMGGRLIQLLHEAETLRAVWRQTDQAKAMLFATHRLEITEFAIQMMEAVRPLIDVSFDWEGEHQLRLVKKDGAIFRPDGLGYLRLPEGMPSLTFFFEWDRGREKVKRAIGQKIKHYLDYKAHPIAWQDRFAHFPPLVMVTTGEERRRQNMQVEIERRLMQAGLSDTDFVVLLGKAADLEQYGVIGAVFHRIGNEMTDPVSLLGRNRQRLLGEQ